MTIESKYLSKMDEIIKYRDTHYVLRDNRLLVEKLEKPDIKTKSNIIIATNPDKKYQLGALGANSPEFYMVLDIGQGYMDEDFDGNKFITRDNMDVEIGDILMIPEPAVTLFSWFGPIMGYVPDTLGITRENEYIFRWKGIEAYELFFKGFSD